MNLFNAVLSLLFLMPTLCALPVGNCLSPDIFDHGLWDARDPYFSWGKCTHIRYGYYGDFVFNRDMEEITHGNPGPDIERLTLMTNGGSLTLDIQDFLDLFLVIGATKITYNMEGMFGDFAYFDFSTAFSWSLGAVLDLWHCGCFGLGMEAQYFQTKPLLDSYTNFATGQMIYFNHLNKMKWREWQGAITATYQLIAVGDLLFAPYMGISASSGKLRQYGFEFDDNGLTQTLNLLETKKLWGYALGLTVVSKGILGCTIEGRWADEKALYGAVQLSY